MAGANYRHDIYTVTAYKFHALTFCNIVSRNEPLGDAHARDL